MAENMNNLTGADWLKHSFSIWRDIRKTSEEMALKHPAMFRNPVIPFCFWGVPLPDRGEAPIAGTRGNRPSADC